MLSTSQRAPGERFQYQVPPTPSPRSKQQVDVLIVGCGPAGLTLAAQLSAFAGINTRIVERKAGPLELGQADGVACRTMEMPLHSESCVRTRWT